MFAFSSRRIVDCERELVNVNIQDSLTLSPSYTSLEVLSQSPVDLSLATDAFELLKSQRWGAIINLFLAPKSSYFVPRRIWRVKDASSKVAGETGLL